jgi:hypothetical protein
VTTVDADVVVVAAAAYEIDFEDSVVTEKSML